MKQRYMFWMWGLASRSCQGWHSVPNVFVERDLRPRPYNTGQRDQALYQALEEYGLPAPLAARLGQFVPLNLPAGQIDEVLDRLCSMPRVAGLSRFEEEMLRDTINNL
jgi:hypothetical protein